jgi:TonB family protein
MGNLGRDEVQKVVRRHRKEIMYCYERGLKRDSTLSGKVAVKLIVGPDGTVRAAAVAQSTVHDDQLEACMLERIRRWRFPARKDNGLAAVTHAWVFKPDIEL